MKNKLLLLALILPWLYWPLSNVVSKSNPNTIVLSKSNTLTLSGEVDGDSVGELLIRAKELNGSRFSGNKPIYLFLNTPGGSVQSGLELIEGLNGLSRPVNTISLFSASMGFQLVQNLGERLILRNGLLMSHRAQGEFAGYFGGQFPSQIDSRYNFWLSRIKEMDEHTVSRTNGKQTLESYQKAYANELWLTGSQAVDGGYADRVVSLACDSSLDGVTTHKIEFFGIHILYDLDNCPINTSPLNIRLDPEELKALQKEKDKEKAEKSKTAVAAFAKQYTDKQRAVIPFKW